MAGMANTVIMVAAAARKKAEPSTVTGFRAGDQG